MRGIKISPSLMCVDFMHVGKALDTFATCRVEYLHVDIMDGHYVPNFTLGTDFCASVAANTSTPLDVHLMIEDVDHYIDSFVNDGGVGSVPGSIICFHPEAVYHPLRTLELIKRAGVRRGIAIDPATPLSSVKPLLPDIDMLCVMTVNPGYSGQKLVPHTLDKVAEAAALRESDGFDFEIEVDGNVSWQNIPGMLTCGADVLVAGSSSIFDGKHALSENILKLREIIESMDKC